jgi:hypothetical protein
MPQVLVRLHIEHISTLSIILYTCTSPLVPSVSEMLGTCEMQLLRLLKKDLAIPDSHPHKQKIYFPLWMK